MNRVGEQQEANAWMAPHACVVGSVVTELIWATLHSPSNLSDLLFQEHAASFGEQIENALPRFGHMLLRELQALYDEDGDGDTLKIMCDE